MRVRHRRRPGFTLIELLVTLAIIALLAALTTAAVMRFSSTGPAAATRANFGKIHIALETQLKAVRDEAERGNMTTQPAFLNRAKTIIGATSDADPRVKAAFVTLKLIQAFPMNFGEVYAPAGDTALAHPDYLRFLTMIGVTAGNYTSVPEEVQRSICVLMILEKGPKGAGITVDDLSTSAVGPLSLGNTIGTTTRGLIDGWRNPILFTRTYNNQANILALCSAGSNRKFGFPPANYGTFIMTLDADGMDDIVVFKP